MMDEDKALDFVYEIERDCDKLSKDIIVRLCKRAIKEMNKQPATLAGSTDDYPARFTFFDILSIELQSKTYAEINSFLEQFVENTLDSEYEKLSAIEQFVLDHSECADNCECDYQAVKHKIHGAFHELLNEHWTIAKIQNFLLR